MLWGCAPRGQPRRALRLSAPRPTPPPGSALGGASLRPRRAPAPLPKRPGWDLLTRPPPKPIPPPSRWDPSTDKHLARNYSLSDFKAGKAANKAALQKELGLPVDPDVPLLVGPFGGVGRGLLGGRLWGPGFGVTRVRGEGLGGRAPPLHRPARRAPSPPLPASSPAQPLSQPPSCSTPPHPLSTPPAPPPPKVLHRPPRLPKGRRPHAAGGAVADVAGRAADLPGHGHAGPGGGAAGGGGLTTR